VQKGLPFLTDSYNLLTKVGGHKMIEPFTTPQTAAPDIDVVLRYLHDSHGDGCLYRGQSQQFDARLLPSQFRRDLKTKTIFTRSSPEFEYTLFKRGDEFVGNYAPGNEPVQQPTSSETSNHEVRDTVRLHLFDSFGYVLGAIFAQQYGFKSEMLDATTDLDVAAFWRTRPEARILAVS
jgi:hypothetical protein